ncbi:MAG TPA: hypothetical protein VL400_16145 [Polyangiaceae bacterium]|nr:hypothetical protein [Polyangiaceae bacterium]
MAHASWKGAVLAAVLATGAACESEVTDGTDFGPGGAGGGGGTTQGGGSPATTSVGTGGAGGGGGSGPACKTFGDACTACAAEPAACADPYCACLASPVCAGLWQCFLQCDAGDEACRDACELASPGGYAALLATFDCLGDACSESCGGALPLKPCPSCWVDRCATELDGCIGDASCNEMLDCMSACSAPGCVGDCEAAAPDNAARDALFACSAGECADTCGAPTTCQGLGDACTDCAFASSACNASYCECFASSDCTAYASCVKACAPADEACNDACELSDAAGFSAYYRMATCMGQDCSASCGFSTPASCFSCTVAECGDELDPCMGDADSNQFFDCALGCSDEPCKAACYAALPDTTLVDGLLACQNGACDALCPSPMPPGPPSP